MTDPTFRDQPPADWDARDPRDHAVAELVRAARDHAPRRSPAAIARTRAAVMAELAADRSEAQPLAPVIDLGNPPRPARGMGAGEWLRLAAVCAAGFALGSLWVASGTDTPAVASRPGSSVAAVSPAVVDHSPATNPDAASAMIVPVSNGPAPAARALNAGPAYEARQFLLLQQLQVGALIEDDASELGRLQSLERNLIPDPAAAVSLTASERQAVAAYREGERALGELQAEAARERFAAARRAAPGTTMALLAQLRLAGLDVVANGDAPAARASFATALAEYDRVVGAPEWRPALAELAGQ